MRAQDGHIFDILMETDASPQPKRRLSPRIIILLTVVNLMLLTLGTFALGLFRPPATPTSAEERSSSLSIAIAPFDGCPNVSDDLTEALEQHFADSLSVQKRASEAPDDSATEDLSLFISGSCDQNGEVTSKFELLEEMREVPELYHPRTLTIEESDQNAGMVHFGQNFG